MPVMNCTKNGKPGRKWGSQGWRYTGKDAEIKAKAQGKAIHAAKK